MAQRRNDDDGAPCASRVIQHRWDLLGNNVLLQLLAVLAVVLHSHSSRLAVYWEPRWLS